MVPRAGSVKVQTGTLVTFDDIVFAYACGVLVFLVAIGIAVRRQIGSRAVNEAGFRRELRVLVIVLPYIVVWPAGFVRWNWLVGCLSEVLAGNRKRHS